LLGYLAKFLKVQRGDVDGMALLDDCRSS